MSPSADRRMRIIFSENPDNAAVPLATAVPKRFLVKRGQLIQWTAENDSSEGNPFQGLDVSVVTLVFGTFNPTNSMTNSNGIITARLKNKNQGGKTGRFTYTVMYGTAEAVDPELDIRGDVRPQEKRRTRPRKTVRPPKARDKK